MTISATQLKKNLGKYLELAKTEDIIISKNGNESYILTRKHSDEFNYLDGLLRNSDYDQEDINQSGLKWERLKNV